MRRRVSSQPLPSVKQITKPTRASTRRVLVSQACARTTRPHLRVRQSTRRQLRITHTVRLTLVPLTKKKGHFTKKKTMQQQLTSPSKMPSLRGILLARTHFQVLGFDTDSLGVRDISDADVRAAYRRMALRCHPDKCQDLVRKGGGLYVCTPNNNNNK